jgi:hypothetical protein
MSAQTQTVEKPKRVTLPKNTERYIVAALYALKTAYNHDLLSEDALTELTNILHIYDTVENQKFYWGEEHMPDEVYDKTLVDIKAVQKARAKAAKPPKAPKAKKEVVFNDATTSTEGGEAPAPKKRGPKPKPKPETPIEKPEPKKRGRKPKVVESVIEIDDDDDANDAASVHTVQLEEPESEPVVAKQIATEEVDTEGYVIKRATKPRGPKPKAKPAATPV